MGKKNKILNYIISIFIPVIIGGVVGLIMSNYIDYESLNKPALSPPASIFPIMWTILYILMGISYAILKNNDKVDSKVNKIYYLQLIVNALWSIIFFVLKLRLVAFLWIVLLCTLVIYMIIVFYKKEKIAGILQILYLVWILFATYLNFFVFLLNK